MSNYEKRLGTLVKELGGRYYKFVSPGHSGVPDRLCVLPHGIVFFVEIKEDGDRLRSHQKRELTRLQHLDHYSYLVGSLKEVNAVAALMKIAIKQKEKSYVRQNNTRYST